MPKIKTILTTLAGAVLIAGMLACGSAEQPPAVPPQNAKPAAQPAVPAQPAAPAAAAIPNPPAATEPLMTTIALDTGRNQNLPEPTRTQAFNSNNNKNIISPLNKPEGKLPSIFTDISIDLAITIAGGIIVSILLSWWFWRNRVRIFAVRKPNDMSTGALFGWILVFIIFITDIIATFSGVSYNGGTIIAFGIILFFLSNTIK